MNISNRIFFGAAICAIVFAPGAALAHSTVAPSQTTPATYETFTLSVPSEREVPTIGIRLLIPEGLDRVTPFVKAGWDVEITRNAADEVVELAWTGGSVPAHQKDTFQFTARTPGEDTKLIWRAYQTYQGGEVVAWDQNPDEPAEGEDSVSNPYSTTEVRMAGGSTEDATAADGADSMAFPIAIGAFIISVVALGLSIRRT